MSEGLALWLSIGAGALAILFGVISTQWILKQPAGNDRMQEIAAAIQEGAKYLEKYFGGRGVLLGGVPGVPPVTSKVSSAFAASSGAADTGGSFITNPPPPGEYRR